MKISLLLGLLVFLSTCGLEKTSNDRINEIEYSFFVAGHTYGSPGVDNVGVHPPFRAKFDFINADPHIDFGIFTGDIVVRSTSKNWDEIDHQLNMLEDTVYFAPGNHDLQDRDLYESRYGRTYQHFVHEADLFIILDPNIDGWNISGDQLVYLKHIVENLSSEVANVFVFFHQVLWWSPKNEFKKVALNAHQGRAEKTNFWTEIVPLFENRDKDVFMFAGDLGAHDNGSEFMFGQKGDLKFVGSGMGGGVRDNFIIVDVFEDKTVNFRLIALNAVETTGLGNLEDYILP